MSVIVKISDLSNEQVNNITSELSIVPFDEREEIMRKRGLKYNSKPKSPVTMFIVNTEDETIALPYRFACLLFGKKMNMDLDHKKLENMNFLMNLREEQVPVAEEALQQLDDKNTTTLGVRPGFGKTLLGALIIYLKALAGIIFITREMIGDGWLVTFKICLPMLKIWYVGKKTELFKENEIPLEMPDVIICMNERYKKIPKNFLKKIGICIVDEAHMFCTRENVECLLCTQPQYVVLESGTLERSDDKMERMVQKIAGEHGIFIIPDIPFVCYKVNTNVLGDEQKGSQGLDAQKLYKSLAENETRNSIIMNIVKNNPHRKFMLLTRTKGHVEELARLCFEYEIDHDTMYGNKRSYNDSKCLIGTIPKMGTGMDEARACKDFGGHESDTLIFCLSVKKYSTFVQVLGRVMRCIRRGATPACIWLQDKNAMVKGHFKGLKDDIEKINGTIISMDYECDGVILYPENII